MMAKNGHEDQSLDSILTKKWSLYIETLDRTPQTFWSQQKTPIILKKL